MTEIASPVEAETNDIQAEMAVAASENAITPAVEAALALVHGEAITLPEDLYIPPDALRVFLEAFEGPLDLLLYLIKKQNIDILDIPIARITRQYVEYVELMHGLRFELAAEYLVMAAVLAEIKSRMLLPRAPEEEAQEEDPRAELVRRLQEYEQFKKAAEVLDSLPQEGRDVFPVEADTSHITVDKPLPNVDIRDLILALKEVLKRGDLRVHHHIQFEALSIRERMTSILDRINLNKDSFVEFTTLFDPKEGRIGVVVTFLAMLELLKQALIEVLQNEPFSPIHVRVITEEDLNSSAISDDITQ